MESIFSIDVETIVSPYGAKYTHEIEVYYEIILQLKILINIKKKLMIDSIQGTTGGHLKYIG